MRRLRPAEVGWRLGRAREPRGGDTEAPAEEEPAVDEASEPESGGEVSDEPGRDPAASPTDLAAAAEPVDGDTEADSTESAAEETADEATEESDKEEES